MKLLYKVSLFALGFLALSRLYFYATDDFRLSNITYPFGFVDVQQEPIPPLFDQPYSYLGKGAQSYVFLSEDKKHVLKFFKFKHIKPALFDSEKQVKRKQRKLERLFAGYRIAQKHQVPGLTYIHLSPQDHSEPVVRLYDKLGLPRKVHLDQVVFIVQEAGTTFEQELSQSLSNKDVETAKTLIAQIFDLYFSEYRKGLVDRDHRVMDNMGFHSGKAFHMDVGMLTESPTIAFDNFHDMEKVAYTINHWVAKNYSEFSDELKIFMEGKLTAHYNYPFQFTKTYHEVLKHTH